MSRLKPNRHGKPETTERSLRSTMRLFSNAYPRLRSRGSNPGPSVSIFISQKFGSDVSKTFSKRTETELA